MDFTDFNAAFFSGAFEEPAVYTPAGGEGATIPVVFRSDYEAAQAPGTDGSVESAAPVATCRESDVPAAAHGSTLSVRGVTYTVVEIHPDGTGLVDLILSRDS